MIDAEIFGTLFVEKRECVGGIADSASSPTEVKA
jgi:hypothetical protein